MNSYENLKLIYQAALEAVNPEKIIPKKIQLNGHHLIIKQKQGQLSYDLEKFKNIYLVGDGKATAYMAKAIEKILGERITQGLISVKYGHSTDLKKIKIIEAGHPLPDLNGFKAANKTLEIVKQAQKDDLIIALLSGGGSALWPLPPQYVSLKDKQDCTNFLLRAGASIDEVNTVRKHLSLIKGGQLATAGFPATILSFLISDVVGDKIDLIASGPFVFDPSTFKMAKDIIKKYDLASKVSKSILDYLNSGLKKEETNPKKIENQKKYFSETKNVIIASNLMALKAAKNKAAQLGYHSQILSSTLTGDTKELAKNKIALAKKIILEKKPLAPPWCLLSGGETTVQVKGHGLGGRNLEFCLHTVEEIKEFPNFLVASLGTDGTDGPTEAAGAWVDGNSFKQAKDKGLTLEKFLQENDSYHFFKELGNLIITGPTKTNVMDLRIMIYS